MSKKIVISGGTKGLGLELAKNLSDNGNNVFVGGRQKPEGNFNFKYFPLDVTDEQSVQQFHQSIIADGLDIDVLINNAGIGVFKGLLDTTEKEWDQLFAVNTKGTFLITKAFIPSLLKTKGLIVSVTSDVSSRTFDFGGLYCATKHAQKAFLRSVQQEFFEQGLRLTEIKPGRMATPFAGNKQTPNDDWLDPKVVAAAIEKIIDGPANIRVDELMIHPLGQEPEF